MPSDDAARGHGDPAGRLVLVLVGRFDLRTTAPLRRGWSIPASSRRALHVASSDRELWELSERWMAQAHPLPLHTVEVDGSVARTVAKVVEYELDSGFREVVVVIGRLALGHWWHRLLHDRTADSIVRAVATVPSASVQLMTVATT